MGLFTYILYCNPFLPAYCLWTLDMPTDLRPWGHSLFFKRCTVGGVDQKQYVKSWNMQKIWVAPAPQLPQSRAKSTVIYLFVTLHFSVSWHILPQILYSTKEGLLVPIWERRKTQGDWEVEMGFKHQRFFLIYYAACLNISFFGILLVRTQDSPAELVPYSFMGERTLFRLLQNYMWSIFPCEWVVC